MFATHTLLCPSAANSKFLYRGPSSLHLHECHMSLQPTSAPAVLVTPHVLPMLLLEILG